MCDEAVALGGLPLDPPTGQLEGGQETPHVAHVMLHQLYGTLKFHAILDGHCSVHVSGDDVMVFAIL